MVRMHAYACIAYVNMLYTNCLQACTANQHAAASFACSNGAVQVLCTLVLAHGKMLMCRHHHKRDNPWI
jgi:hypothetical protein